ncbi:magnesium transporter [Corynebacterium aurimucosum]|uniref:Magnesium transporter MgtE n=2 Tax=Corynebacterium TaxID=1716 RepID=A0ABT0T977_9CORY|nr:MULTISPECIES: magnesium transporter [Corynebacterium]MDK6807623.1 magnesium transporter [Corynebacterium aurimucosum]MCL8493633.1 magnesium transporter [Corynebacterium intestinale]MCP1389865.1 magnesium transporter [Corynebacterium intestinale]MTE10542.1 magnesium transporter [Corynebacterium guaraldiae]NJJ83826.1 magnesium transporter [Corynebacterium aurimucosum]
MAETIEQAAEIVEEWLKQEDAIDPQKAPRLQELLARVPRQELIAIVERQNALRAALALRLLPRQKSIAVFDALDAKHQADIIDELGNADVYEFFDELDPEDRVALLDELPAEIADRLLRSLTQTQRDVTGVILGYTKGSVGRRMSPEVPNIHPEMSMEDALRTLRDNADELETIYTVPVTRKDRRLVGVVSLRELFTAERGILIEDIMNEPVYAYATADAEETVRWFLPLDMLALPIVDDSHRLVGLLTWDDATDIMEEADSEDSARSGGTEALQQPYLSTPLLKLVRSRILWLLVLAVSALLTVRVLDSFEDTLAKAVVLSLFIPLLTGTGGNTGNQAATTVTRALALGDVRTRDLLAVMWRELRVGMLLGAVLGLAGLVLATVIYGLDIGLVIGSTLFLICSMSATVGGLMPIVAKTVGADPAVFSNPFISTFCDATGLIVYFFIAKSVLGI